MQWREPHLGAITQQQEHEGDVEQCRIELPGTRDQDGPDHGIRPLADHRPRRHVDQNGAEQRERDADAAENEIFPGRLQRLMGAVDTDHQHRGERRDFDGDPHQADIVGKQREVHREHQRLVHRVIETHEGRRQPADVDLVADIAGTEHACREADEGREHDEDLVEVVDEQILPRDRLDHEQRRRG